MKYSKKRNPFTEFKLSIEEFEYIINEIEETREYFLNRVINNYAKEIILIFK